jgi:SAM-dependent methyltransferase
MIEHLLRVVPAATTATSRAGPDHPMRQVTRQIAFDPDGWTPERAATVTELFDGLAPEWHTRAGEPRLEVVADAVARGGPMHGGTWLELGSGTGLLTPWLAAHCERLVAVDLAAEMLRRAPAGAGWRVRADGAALPVPDGSVDALVLINAFLFPAEARRVIAPSGVLVWVNTAGAGTPIYLTAEDALLAMGQDAWTGRASEAALGTWAVLRRSRR